MKKEEVTEKVIEKVKSGVKTFIGMGIDYDKSIHSYEAVLKQDPLNPFALYYLASAQFNREYKKGKVHISKSAVAIKELLPWKTATYIDDPRTQLKQCFRLLIPLFKKKMRKCVSQVITLQLANMHQDPCITAGTPYFQEQKEHEIEVYNHFISTMEDVTGRNITKESISDSLNLGKDDDGKDDDTTLLILWNWVKALADKQEFAKKPRIAKNHQDRLKLMLATESTYYTHSSAIKRKIEKLTAIPRCTSKGKSCCLVEQNDLQGTLPDKSEFWDTLVKNKFLTDIEKCKEGEFETIWGYWNPTVSALDSISDFKQWYITEESFDWISGLTKKDRITIVENLRKDKIINEKGRLIDFSNKSLNLPDFIIHSKSIKDTLLRHCVYWFVLHHLSESCCTIELHHDGSCCDDTIKRKTSPAPKSAVHEVLISMNPEANVSHPHEQIHHIKMSTPSSTSYHTINSDSFYDSLSLTKHAPNEEINDQFLKQLQRHSLRITYVSGIGMNCMINALIQHSKHDYLTSYFIEEAGKIRRRLCELFPDASVNGMLHCDDQIAEYILKMINDTSDSKIGKVSVVIASSDGPIIYGGTSDLRYAEPVGRHVVLWQQGYHYVPIIHLKDYMDSLQKFSQSDENVEDCGDVPCQQLTPVQLKKLHKLHILSKQENNSYKICIPMDQISTLVSQATSEFSSKEIDDICKFFKTKLKVNFSTLNNASFLGYFASNEALFKDLQKYHVVKGITMKLTFSDFEQILGKMFHVPTGNVVKKISIEVLLQEPMTVDWSSINDFLESKKTCKAGIQQEKCKSLGNILLDKFSADLASADVYTDDDFTSQQKKAMQDYIKAIYAIKSDPAYFNSIVTALHNNFCSSILSIETPEITFKKLEHCDVFKERIQEKGDVIGWFSNNGCSFIITLAERKWSTRMLFRSGFIVGLGLAQIAAGIAFMLIPGVGIHFGQALIGEGISDIIFAGMGLVKGHVTWNQYFVSKLISLSFTAIFGGIGQAVQAILKSTMLSKYAFAVFGKESIAQLPIDVFAKRAAQLASKQVAVSIATLTLKTGVSIAANAIELSSHLKKVVNGLITRVDSFIGQALELFDSAFDKVRQELSKMMLKSTMILQDNESNRSAVRQYFNRIFNSAKIQVLSWFNKEWNHIDEKVASLLKHFQGGVSQLAAYIVQCEKLVKECTTSTLMKEVIDSIKFNSDEFQAASTSEQQNQKLLDEAEMLSIMKEELQNVRDITNDHMRGKSQLLVSKFKILIDEQLDAADMERIDSNQDHDIQLSEYEKALNAADQGKRRVKRHASQIVQEYENKMKQLMSCRQNPLIFARIIEHHDTLLVPTFAISFMEEMLKCPITLVNKDKFQLCKSMKKGEPLVVTYTSDENHYGSFSVNNEVFTYEEYGNNYLLFAMMMEAHESYLPHELRKKIADKCTDKNHSLYKSIVSSTHDYIIEFRLAGVGKLNIPHNIYKFVTLYAKKVQKLPVLNNIGKHQLISKSTLNELGLCLVYIIPISRIKELVLEALESRNHDQLKNLLVLLPSVEEVNKGTSAFGKGAGKEAFLEVFGQNKLYRQRVCRAETIINQCAFNKFKMTNRNFEELISILNSAPANSYLNLDNVSDSIKCNELQRRIHYIHENVLQPSSKEEIQLMLHQQQDEQSRSSIFVQSQDPTSRETKFFILDQPIQNNECLIAPLIELPTSLELSNYKPNDGSKQFIPNVSNTKEWSSACMPLDVNPNSSIARESTKPNNNVLKRSPISKTMKQSSACMSDINPNSSIAHTSSKPSNDSLKQSSIKVPDTREKPSYISNKNPNSSIACKSSRPAINGSLKQSSISGTDTNKEQPSFMSDINPNSSIARKLSRPNNGLEQSSTNETADVTKERPSAYMPYMNPNSAITCKMSQPNVGLKQSLINESDSIKEHPFYLLDLNPKSSIARKMSKPNTDSEQSPVNESDSTKEQPFYLSDINPKSSIARKLSKPKQAIDVAVDVSRDEKEYPFYIADINPTTSVAMKLKNRLNS